MILFDAHCHLYQSYRLEQALTGAFAHFFQEKRTRGIDPASPGVLLLAATAGGHTLVDLERLLGVSSRGTGLNRVEIKDDGLSLHLKHADYPGQSVVIVAGQQVVTAERIEVLSLANRNHIADNATLPQTIDAIRRGGAVAMVPWGAGKWMGTRARIITDYLKTADPTGFFLGDSGNRPGFWPTPTLFVAARSRRIAILSGTDPLPLAGEESRLGSFGTILDAELDLSRPAVSLLEVLSEPAIKVFDYGVRQHPLGFIRRQLSLRLQRHGANKKAAGSPSN
jgi:hypothetical protein